LAIQLQLGEPLNLNGDLLDDLLDERVVHCANDGEEGLAALMGVVSGLDMAVERMAKFRSEHAIWDDEYRPRTYRRIEQSRFETTASIPVVLKRKRASDQSGETAGEPAAKRAKNQAAEKPTNAKGRGKAKTASKAPPKPASKRRLRSGKAA
jgi:hypothetical protein